MKILNHVAMSKQAAALHRGGQVRRFHAHPTVRQQNVAEHTYGVMALVMVLTNFTPSRELMIAALLHDTAEQVTGDIPSPTKRLMDTDWDEYEAEILASNYLTYPKLSESDKRVLKLADIIDGALFAAREAALGNHALREVYDVYCAYARELHLSPEEAGILDDIRRIAGLEDS